MGRWASVRIIGVAFGISVLAGPVAAMDFPACLAELRGLAVAGGVAPSFFDSATRDLQPNDVAPFQDRQPEFTVPVWDYLASLVDEERVTDGKARMRDLAAPLNTAAARFGVDPATIAAVWGVESDFGRSFGKRPVLASLATLSCAGGRRQSAFRPEFVAALKILQSGDVRPERFIGSWAGAFGQTQFMPTTFLKLGVDLDGDGRRDVVDSAADALGSTANFLRAHGWSNGETWGFEVRVPAGYDGPSGRKNKQPISAWAARGITRFDGGPLSGAAAGLLLPAGPNGPAFLVTKNFEALYAYNNAESYALAIALLSDRLRGAPGLQTPWPTQDRPLSRADRRELQALLNRRGYQLGDADGVIGGKTQAAIADFQDKSGLPRDGRPDGRVLDALRAAGGSSGGGGFSLWPFNRN